MSATTNNDNNNGASNKLTNYESWQQAMERAVISKKGKVNNELEKIDITGANLVAFDHDEDTQEFFYKEVLDFQDKGDEFEAMKEAGELTSLDPLVKKVLRGTIAKSKMIVATLAEEIIFIEKQLAIEHTDAEKSKYNQRTDGTGYYFVDGNLYLPTGDDEHDM